MGAIGTRVEEQGTLLREKGGYVLRRDVGGRWKLDLHRVSVDNIGKRALVSGVIVANGLVDPRIIELALEGRLPTGIDTDRLTMPSAIAIRWTQQRADLKLAV